MAWLDEAAWERCSVDALVGGLWASVMIAAVVGSTIVTGCGAADRVGEAAHEVEQAVQRVECLEDEDGICPVGARAWELCQLAVDDCYDVVAIDSGPDAQCCFAVTLELSVGRAVDGL